MKIKISELQIFLNSYYKGDYPNQRLGQAFMNVIETTETNPSLFYEDSNYESIKKIYEQYVNFTP